MTWRANSVRSPSLLAQEGLEQERRALRCAVRDLQVEAEAGALTLSFTLGRGQFATAVLREICDLAEPAQIDSGRGVSRRGSAQQHVHGAGAAVDGRAEVNASTSAWRLSQVFTAILRIGPRAPER